MDRLRRRSRSHSSHNCRSWFACNGLQEENGSSPKKRGAKFFVDYLIAYFTAAGSSQTWELSASIVKA
jgi:hypothetical protein